MLSTDSAWSPTYRKVEVLERGEGSVAFRPILKVKGEVQDLGEYNSEKEAAIAYDVVKLKVAIEHGLDPATLKLNHSSAAFEGHPLFSYLLRECTLSDTCRLLREGLVEEFLEKERPRRQAAMRAEATTACGDAVMEEEEDLASDIAVPPQCATQLPMPQQQCTMPAAGGSSQSPAPSPSQAASLRSTWAEEPAGSGRFLINVSTRVIRMHELSLPVSVRQALFGQMPSGSSITICSASEDDRWLAEYYEYARSQNCTKACLRQLQSLTRDGGLEVGDVLAFRQGRRPGELTLEVHSRESQEASSYISSLAVTEAPGSSPSGGTPPSTAAKKRSSPALDANPAPKKQRTAAADKENSPGGAARDTARQPSAEAETPATAACSRGVLSPKQPKLLPAPGSAGRAALAKPASAGGGSKSKAAAVATPTAKSRPSSSKARTSWAEFPPGSGAHTVVLSESACRNSNLNITVYRAGQVFGEVLDCEVTVHSIDTGKQHRWTHKQYASNTNQVYLHALTEYMQSVKANPGDVLSLKHVRQGTADVTLWRKGSESAKAFMAHLNSGQADVSPPAKAGGAPGSAAKSSSPPASQKKQKQKKELGTKQPSPAGTSKPAAAAKTAETTVAPPAAKTSGPAATRPGRRERRSASAPAAANPAVAETASEPEAAAAAGEAPVPSEAAPPSTSVHGGPASSEQRPAGASKKAGSADTKPAAAAITARAAVEAKPAAAATAAAAVEAKPTAPDPAAASVEAKPAAAAASPAAHPVASAQVAQPAVPAKGPSPGRLTRQAAATQQGSTEAKPSGTAKPPSTVPLAAVAQAAARSPLGTAPKAFKVSPPAAVKLFLYAGKAAAQADRDAPTAKPSHGMPPPSSIAAVVKRAPNQMLGVPPQAAAAAPAKQAPGKRGAKQLRGGGTSFQAAHNGGVLTRRSAVAHAAGAKRPRKQPSPHRAATGEPNTLAYAAAVVAVSQLPNKRQRLQLGGEGDSIKDVAGQQPLLLLPLGASHAATGCCYGMGCAQEPSAAGGASSQVQPQQLQHYQQPAQQQQRRPLQRSSHKAPSMVPSAHSTQSCPMPVQQVQLPPAAPENLAPHDMQSIYLNMAKLVDEVVDRGQLSLGAAAAFRRRFMALAEPGTSWQHYSFLHKLWTAGEWAQLGTWMRAGRQA